MDYDFINMGNEQFESLAQSLMQKLLGSNSIVFGKGPDGGRELTFNGQTNFPNERSGWTGYWVVQAKYKSREDISDDSFNWVKRNISSELEKFQTKKRQLPDNYIFITNVVLTPVEKKGGRDKIEDFVKNMFPYIPNILIIAYDELCKLLDNNLNVRSAYTHMITPGDILYRLLGKIDRNEQNTVLANKEIRESQEGHVKNYGYLVDAEKDNIISIDFGSSYSLIAYLDDTGVLVFIKSDKQQVLVPTCITFFDNGSYIIGRPEYKNIKEAITIVNFKREIGRNKVYSIFNQRRSGEELSELFLKSLKQNIIDHFGTTQKNVVISKPTYFTINQTNYLLQIFENAGFLVRRAISESSASSLNYANSFLLETNTSDYHLTIDFGGGTLDLNVVCFGDGVYEIKDSYGDSYLGGFDYDESIFEYCLSEMKKVNIYQNENSKKELLYECERAKIELSNSLNQSIIIIRDRQTEEGNLQDIRIALTKVLFENITSKLNRKIFNLLYLVSEKYKIKSILICGQGAKIFTIQDIIRNLFPHTPVIDAYAENAVVKGLTINAGVLEGKVKNTLLLDTLKEIIAVKCVTPVAERIIVLNKISHNFKKEWDYGLISSTAMDNFSFSNLSEEDATIPTRKKNSFKIINKNNSDSILIDFYEFDRSTKRYLNLGTHLLKGIAGKEELNIIIDVDANSTIHIQIELDKILKTGILINNFHLGDQNTLKFH